MKYLEYTPLDRINDFLSHLDLGERTIKGCLEAYSCKHTGTDKKLSLSLEHEILDYLGKSSDADSSSPVEYMCSKSRSYRLADKEGYGATIFLPFTSAVKAHQFFTEESWDCFKQIFDAYMFEVSKEWAEANEGCPLLDTLYKALDERCRWSFTFFFYNRKLKRVVSFHFSCLSNLVAEGFLMEEGSWSGEGEIFDDMDI
ncbi:hypothetical protein RHGRI_026221 [Rhododendron griersonianum]|uniref:Repressor of RNA polymerase III transcription n=1 Tax=Rhododendron griersonianum TaxID=479676 RepID=A0AAV6IRW8_9ERIC|nr:hypothetical protein RHGRI_026221 [Rhododendron griersonianum]